MNLGIIRELIDNYGAACITRGVFQASISKIEKKALEQLVSDARNKLIREILKQNHTTEERVDR
jgi:hypothetical protein